jgi:parvulin-like peptidyl-prolyl isomerase
MNRHPRATAFALVAALALTVFGAFGCASNEGVAARVDGVAIKLSDIDTQLATMKKQSPTTFQGTEGAAREQDYRARILDSLVQIQLIKAAAAKAGISVSDTQVNAQMKTLETQYGGKTGLDNAMKQAGVSSDQLKENLRSRMLVDALSKKVAPTPAVTDAQIADFYAKNKTMFADQEQVHARHILFTTADKATADKVLAQLKAGGDFAALAKQYSKDPGSAAKGGDLGWASPTTYVQPFADAVKTMSKNEIRMVESTFGWHIIQLLDRKPAADKTLVQVKDQVKQLLQQQEQSKLFQTYLDKLKKDAKIEVLDPKLKTAYDALSKTQVPATTPTPAK